MRTVIEVGANDGGNTRAFLDTPDTAVYCFEPTVELQLILQQKFKKYENFHLIPAAVHIQNGFEYFNVAGTSDWGCSSLYEFSENLETIWPNRPDFHRTDRYKVMTLRLDTFFDLYNIGEVDYLWIDAQGSDFNVLKSLGSKISNIKQGKCEAAHQVELYKTKDNNAFEIKRYMEANGFDVWFEHPHQEVDVHFRKK